ncbi:MAG: c-type cytochrome [Chloroflexi bacterium]|nr:c-type cytochrome [Chloroflexota bacterium]
MKKLGFLLVSMVAFALAGVLAVTVFASAQGDAVPPPYAGLKNPFPWSDSSAQAAGKGIYQRSCLGCHGATGGGLPKFDFSNAAFPDNLEQKADYNFWILSEGRLANGMPPFKSSLTEEQRWQVITYLWSLGKPSQPAETPAAKPATKATLSLTAPQQSQAGKSLTLSATVKDDQGKPIAGAAVEFLLKVDFFTSGLMEIGQKDTNDKGIATLEYTPRIAGSTEVVARYQGAEAKSKLNLVEAGRSFYQTEVGIRFPAPGPEVFIGPESSMELVNEGDAPTSAFRLPDGVLSWLLLLVGIMAFIWFTYFRVLYRVFAISTAAPKKIPGTDVRLLPLAGMGFVILVGVLLVLMLLTGPYTHMHLGG